MAGLTLDNFKVDHSGVNAGVRDSVFINYRRSDSRHPASRIYEHVRRSNGRRNVFMDVDNIPAGKEFPQVLTEALAQAGVLIAIIGETWLASHGDDGKRRLDDPNDFVRREIAQALINKDIVVIPVLLDEARLPAAADLPSDLQQLLTRNAITVRHATWAKDIAGLMTAIRRVLWPVVRARYLKIATRSAAALGVAVLVAFPDWWLAPLQSAGSGVGSIYKDWQTTSVDAGRVTDRAAWMAAERQNTAPAYQTYIDLQPKGEMVAEAARRLAGKSITEAQQVYNSVAGAFSVALAVVERKG